MRTTTTITAKITAGGNDGFTKDAVYFDSGFNTVVMGEDNTDPPVVQSVSCDAFVLFNSLAIPNAATVIVAMIEFQAGNSNTGVVNLKIHCNDEDTAVAPTSEATHDGKSRTTAFTAWSPAEWSNGNDYISLNFASAVQEVVDRGGWSSGNDLMVLLDNNNSANNMKRIFKSYDLTATDCAEITITYKVGFVPSVIYV